MFGKCIYFLVMISKPQLVPLEDMIYFKWMSIWKGWILKYQNYYITLWLSYCLYARDKDWILSPQLHFFVLE